MDKTFTTSAGVVVEIIPVTTLIEKLRLQYRARVKKLEKQYLPPAPMYEIKTATGVVERYPHDETTLQTPEEFAAWADYQKALTRAQRVLDAKRAELDAELSRAQERLIALRGLKFEMPTDDKWVERQRQLGIEVPDDPDARRIHWFETEALVSGSDFVQFGKVVAYANNVPEDELEQVEELFRHKVGRAAGDAAPATPQADHA